MRMASSANIEHHIQFIRKSGVISPIIIQPVDINDNTHVLIVSKPKISVQ